MKPIALKFGGYQEPASIHNRAAGRFGELLTRKLGDRISFELIGSVLKIGRSSGDLAVMVGSGEIDFCYLSTVRFTKWVPELKLLELPFVVKDRKAICAAFTDSFGDLVRRRMRESTPYRLLGLWDNGFRHFTNKVRPTRTPADCKGLRIRSQVSELHVEVFRAFGFEPTPVDVKEFTEEIASGRFDAQEPAHQYLQLRRAQLPPLLHALGQSLRRSGVHLQGGALPELAAGRAGRGGQPGAGGDRLSASTGLSGGCGDPGEARPVEERGDPPDRRGAFRLHQGLAARPGQTSK